VTHAQTWASYSAVYRFGSLSVRFRLSTQSTTVMCPRASSKQLQILEKCNYYTSVHLHTVLRAITYLQWLCPRKFSGTDVCDSTITPIVINTYSMQLAVGYSTIFETPTTLMTAGGNLLHIHHLRSTRKSTGSP